MLYVNKIKELCGCDTETAYKVFQNMVIDFSECTQEQFDREALFVFSRI